MKQKQETLSLICICGHKDNRHADESDWGDGKCELCDCKTFEEKEDTPQEDWAKYFDETSIEDWLDADSHSGRLPAKFLFSDCEFIGELLTPRIRHLLSTEREKGYREGYDAIELSSGEINDEIRRQARQELKDELVAEINNFDQFDGLFIKNTPDYVTKDYLINLIKTK